MSKRLRDNLTSSYFEASNHLNSKRARRRIIAYVESYDDVFFWRSVLNSFENDSICFYVTLPSRVPHLERGKKAVLMSLVADNVGSDMIACVDADYDYLIQGATPLSKTINENPYVFHTYAYAIENLQCYAPSLHQTCVMVTLNDDDIFDFEEFMRQYSQAIYPLFIWSIWFYRTSHYGEFTISDFLYVIETGNVSIGRADNALRNLRQKVGRKTERLRRSYPDARNSWEAVKADLTRLGVTADNTYLFIQGHHLFDKVVVPMLNSVCDLLIRNRENEISRQSVHGIQRNNELSCYANSVEQVSSMLKKNTGYTESEPFKHIQADIQRFLNRGQRVFRHTDKVADSENNSN
jgi:hypothetical protein